MKLFFIFFVLFFLFLSWIFIDSFYPVDGVCITIYCLMAIPLSSVKFCANNRFLIIFYLLSVSFIFYDEIITFFDSYSYEKQFIENKYRCIDDGFLEKNGWVSASKTGFFKNFIGIGAKYELFIQLYSDGSYRLSDFQRRSYFFECNKNPDQSNN